MPITTSRFILIGTRKLLLAGGVLMATAGLAQNVWTYHYDNARTGQNTQETILTPQNVKSAQFGKLFAQPVDGQVYAQPLYVAGLNMAGSMHNVVFVATEADSVYAFDADNNHGSNSNPLWKASLIDASHGVTVQSRPVTGAGLPSVNGCPPSPTPTPSPTPNADLPHSVIAPNIGITSTPVIDLSTNTMYVEAFSCEGTPPPGTQLSCNPNAQSPGVFRHRLHALDITTGNEKFGGPTIIGVGFSAFNSNNSSNGNQLNRPGLLLSQGKVYVGYGSDGADCSDGVYNGWIFAYDAAKLSQISVLNITPKGTTGDGPGGSIWMAGAGLAADVNGNIFVATGNGTFDTTLDPRTRFPVNGDFGDSILKLDQNLNVLDYFTPADQGSLNTSDTDLGSGGVLLLPDQTGSTPHLLVQTGKEGKIFLVNRDQLTTGSPIPTHYCGPPPGPGCSVDPIVQEIPNSALPCGTNCPVAGMWSMPAFWNQIVYFWGGGDFNSPGGPLKSFSLASGTLTSMATATDSYIYPGANMSVSANGTTNGIVWSIGRSTPQSRWRLQAYDALTLSRLYSSSCLADLPGDGIRFSVPIVMNGKVYVGTQSSLAIYGLGPPSLKNRCWWPVLEDLLK